MMNKRKNGLTKLNKKTFRGCVDVLYYLNASNL